MMSKPATITLAGREYALSPLTFGALRAQKDNIRGMALGEFQGAEALFAAMTAIVHASIVRKHPEMLISDVEESLDWPAAQEAVQTVLVISFPAAPPGEPTAESPSGNSTGTPASPNSSRSRAGRGTKSKTR